MRIGDRMLDRRTATVALLVLGVYALALWFERHGIRSPSYGADVGQYRSWATAIAHGSIPYRSLYFPYPPGALPPMLAAEPFAHYPTAFKIVMAVLGAAAILSAAVCLRGLGRRSAWPLLAIAVAPLAVGSVFVNRFDLWPAALMVTALALFAAGRPTLAFAFLAAGGMTKIFPVAALPAAAVWTWRAYGMRTLKRGLLAFVGVALLVFVPFGALGPGGLRYSFTIQLTRHLQVESLGGAVLLVADRLGLYHPTIATGNPGSLDLFGVLPNLVGTASIVVAVLLVLCGAWLVTRGRIDIERLVAASVAAICVYVAFGKVLSPQYLLWLVPLVPLVPLAGRLRAMLPTATLFVALLLTQVEFDHDYRELRTAGPVVWILLARDLLLTALALYMLSASRPSGPLARRVRASAVR